MAEELDVTLQYSSALFIAKVIHTISATLTATEKEGVVDEAIGLVKKM